MSIISLTFWNYNNPLKAIKNWLGSFIKFHKKKNNRKHKLNDIFFFKFKKSIAYPISDKILLMLKFVLKQ